MAPTHHASEAFAVSCLRLFAGYDTSQAASPGPPFHGQTREASIPLLLSPDWVGKLLPAVASNSCQANAKPYGPKMAALSFSFLGGPTPEATARYTNLSRKQDQDQGHGQGSGHDTLVSILSAAQEGRIDFLPFRWLPAQDRAGIGGQAEIYQYAVNNQAGLVFKALRIWMEPWPDGEGDARRWMGVSAVIKEISILSQPSVLSTPYVLKLEGIAWNAQKTFAWPVLVYRRGVPLREYLRGRMKKGTPATLEHRLDICLCLCLGLSALHQSGECLLRFLRYLLYLSLPGLSALPMLAMVGGKLIRAGIVHADLKPDNIIMSRRNWPAESGDEDYAVPVISDLGAALMGSDTDKYQLPRSRGWEAPEWHPRSFQLRNARRMDVYSFGLLAYWLLAWDAKFSQLSDDEEEAEMKRLADQASTARDVTMQEAFGVLRGLQVGQERHHLLAKFFERTLASDPTSRAPSAAELLPLLGGVKQPPSDLPPAAASSSLGSSVSQRSPCRFRLLDWIEQLSLADFRVREHIFGELERMASSTCSRCRRNCSLQAALCCELGFGTEPDTNKRDSFLAAGSWTNEEYVAELGAFLRPSPRSLPRALQYLFQTDLAHEYQRRQELLVACEHLKRETDARSAVLGSDHALVSAMKPMLATVLDAAGKREEALAVQIELYAHLNATLGVSNPETINAMSQLALLYHTAGQVGKALTTGRDAYDLCREFLGESDRTTLSSMANLAIFLYASGRNAEAAELQGRVVEQHQAALGIDHPDTVKCYLNEAVFLRDSVAGAEKAVRRLMGAISRLRNSFGFIHRDALWALSTYTDTVEEGFATHYEVLEVREAVFSEAKRLLGDEHHETWIFATKLAATIGDLGDWVKARSLYEEAQAHLRDLLGPTHEEVFRGTLVFAEAYREQGLYGEAYDLLRDLVGPNAFADIPAEGVYGLMTDCLSAMARVLQDKNKLGEAKPMWEHIIRISEMRYSADADTLGIKAVRDAKSYLAFCYIDEGKQEEGQQMLKELLEWADKHLGPDSFETMTHANDAACHMINTGRYREALDILLLLWEKLTRQPLPTTALCRRIMINLVSALYMADRTHEAISIAEKYLPVLQESVCDSHEDIMQIRCTLSVCYIEVGYLEKAEPVTLTLHETYERRGDEHMCLVTMHNLAMVFKRTGRTGEAIDVQRRVMKRRAEFSGAGSDEYMDDAIDTAQVLLDAGESLDEAARWAKMAWEHFRARLSSGRMAHAAGFLLGQILGRMGRVAEARECFQAVLSAARDAEADNKERWIRETENELMGLEVDK
jgi:serine/threonine protein kinase